MNSFKYSLFVTAVVSLGGFLFGFDASVISGVNGYIQAQFDLSDIQLGWVVSSPTFAATLAMLVAGRISDIFGRKKVLIVVAALYAVSAMFSALAGGYSELVIARMIGGFAFGAALILAPVYIAEIATAERRGQLVSVNQLNIVVGFSAAYFCNYVLNNILANPEHAWFAGLTDKTVWRWMLGIETLPALMYLALLMFVPPSPRWLLMQGKSDQATEVLKKLVGETKSADVENEIRGALNQTKFEQSWTQLFAPSMRLVMFVAILVAILQQITGINAVFFYATTIFEKAGFSSNASFTQAVWVGLINVFATLIAMALIDRLGRKPLMLIGICGVAISLFLAGYGFYTATFELQPEMVVAEDIDLSSGVNQELLGQIYGEPLDELTFKKKLGQALGENWATKVDPLVKRAGNFNSILILTGILGFVASFAISLGPVMWVLLSELFPTRVRGIAISVVGFINSAVSWGVTFIFPWELQNLGSAFTFFVYAGFAVAGLVLLLALLPETKGKTLEQLEAELTG